MESRPRSARLASWLALLTLSFIAIAVSAGYFLTVHSVLSGSVSTEAEINARLITAIINSNPAMWEFEGYRMEAVLSSRGKGKDPEARRVYNLKNERIAESVDPLSPPLLTRSAELYDSGAVVGHIEISRSIKPILARTMLLAISALALACAAYVVLRAFPIRVIAEKEIELQKSEEKYRRLVEDSADGIIVLEKGRDVILDANVSALKMLGLTREQAVGMAHSAIYPPEDAEEYRKRVIPTSEEATTRLDGVRLRNASGARVEVEVSTNVVAFGGRKVVQCRFTDITDRKRVERLLLRAERMAALATLTAGIAHQFNNINSVALGYLQLLETEAGASTASRQYLRSARAAIDRAVEITARLQLLSNPARTVPPPVLAGDVVRAALPSLLPDINRENVTFSVDLRDTRPVSVGREQLDFIVRALIVNARHALLDRPRRELFVETMDSGEETCLLVRDTGVGVAVERRGSLFTPFFSEKGEFAPPGSSQARVKGVGLSLAVAHAIVSGCGGRIQVETEAEAGASFLVCLPVQTAHQGPQGDPN